MPCIAFIGCQGSGKTLGAIREMKKDYDKGMKIYSNIKLIGMDYEKLNIEWFWGYLLEGEELNNIVVFIDELHLFADCRDSKTKVNKVLGYFALQSRKRNVKFYFTTQYFDTIDKRIRLVALDDMIIKSTADYKYINGVKKLIRIKQIILYKEKIFKRYIIKPELYYGLYETGQVLQPIDKESKRGLKSGC